MEQAIKNRIPEFQSLMLPILQHFSDEKPHTSVDLYNAIAQLYQLTEEDLRIKVPSGQMGLFKNRVAWSVSYLKNAGLLFYPQRGVYQITSLGLQVLSKNLTHINIAYLKTLEPFQKWQQGFNVPEENEQPTIVSNNEQRTPEEILGNTVATLNKKLSGELLDILKNKSAAYFEFFVLQLLKKMGYGGAEEDNFEVVGQSGDNGIDGVIYQDKLGIDRVYVQAKRWKDSKVSSKEIRDFIGSLSLKGTNKGIFITTSEFTQDAVSTVKMNPQNRIILIDGTQLADYAIENNVGVQIRKTYEIKDIDNDFFDQL